MLRQKRIAHPPQLALLDATRQMTAKSLPRMDEDDRLMPILSHLSLSFLTNISANDNNFFGEQDPNSEKVTADMVDALAVKHFPACQYNLWRRLKRDRHLKHYGRLQFGLFLKVGRGAFSNFEQGKFCVDGLCCDVLDAGSGTATGRGVGLLETRLWANYERRQV
jgi:hypothetical protein